MIVDAAAYFRALRDSLERARHSVLILGWDFDSGVALDPMGAGPSSKPLRAYFPDLLERNPDLVIRILIWASSVVYAQSQSPPPALDPDWPDHPRLKFRFASHHPLGACHHEKLVCVDDSVAFAGGIDLTALRWDERSHDPDDPARLDARGRPYPPKHDVQLTVDAEAARSLAELARERWLEVTGEEVPEVTGADAWPDSLEPRMRSATVGIARTRAARGDQGPIREAEQLTLDALSAAGQYLYVESQYFTASAVGDCLSELLARPAGAQLVVVLRRECDGVIQRFAMGENRDRLLRRLAAANRHGRLRTYYPVVRDARGEDHEIDVHSKVIAADDRLLRIGSSNLNNRSMGLDTECDLAIEAHDAQSRRVLRALTCELVAEHIGRSAEEFEEALEREGFVGAIDRLQGAKRRRLVLFEVERDGPCEPLPGTGLVDPRKPLI